MHGPKPDNSCGKAFGVLCGRCFPAKTFPVISHCFVSQVCSEVGQESSAPSYTSLEALLFGGVRLGVQKVQWQPHPARFTTDHSTWLWALNMAPTPPQPPKQGLGVPSPTSPGSQSSHCPWSATGCSVPSSLQSLPVKPGLPQPWTLPDTPFHHTMHGVTPDPEGPAAPRCGQGTAAGTETCPQRCHIPVG